DLVGFDRGARRRHAANWHHDDTVAAPVFFLIDSGADPVGERTDGGAAELLALEVRDGFDRGIVTHHHRHVARRAVHFRDRFGRYALDDERHAGSGADA